MPPQAVVQIRKHFHVQAMFPCLSRNAFNQFALRWNSDKYFVNKFRASHSSQIFNLSEHAGITNMIAIEESFKSISKLLILIKLPCQGLTHLSGANNQNVARSEPLFDPADHDSPFHVAQNNHRH